MDMFDATDRFIDQEGLHNFEGQRGVKNLAKLVNAVGYSDTIGRIGQMVGGACLSDIFVFLEDNPGAIAALVDFIRNARSPEWLESIKSKLPDPTNETSAYNQHKNCPECGHKVPTDAIFGEECEQCGHVFINE